MGNDPDQLGLVASLNRPGGNTTGVAQMAPEVAPNRLELLHETRGVQTAAQTLGLEVHALNVSSDSDLDVVFPKLIELRAGGLVISGGQFFNSRSKQLAAKALQYSVPTIFPYVDFAARVAC